MEQQIDPMEIEEINDKIRSGEYFREARSMYSFFAHDPMTERYLYILITSLALLIFLIALNAVGSLFPLGRKEPFVFDSYDIDQELPIVKPLKAYEEEDPNIAVLRFLLRNYVTLREQYDIGQIERNANGVRSQSSTEVYQQYQHYMNPGTAGSPIAQYQRDARRQIVLVSQQIHGKSSADLVFDAYVDSAGRRDQSRWVATVAFDYEDVKVDDNAVITPFNFTVTQYSSRQIQ